MRGALVAVWMFVPFNLHWYVKGGVPQTETLNETLPLVGTARLCGWLMITASPAGNIARGFPAVGVSAVQFAGSLPCPVGLIRCNEFPVPSLPQGQGD